MGKWTYSIPFLILFALLYLFWHELTSTPDQVTSSMVGETLPSFSLPSLQSSSTKFTNTELKGRVSLLTIWASWCEACAIEQPMLLKIANQYHVPIYSINYRDNREAALAWLDKNGNPFVKTGFDQSGEVAIDLGVYGTPETFVISPSGKIIYRHVGVINQKTWENVIYPIVETYQ